jgi:dTDP-4-dehydrorhamnose reductase
MRIACTGYKGNIGSRMVLDYGYSPLTCDIWKPEDIANSIKITKPDIILHLAGRANVNWCEAQENQEDAMQTNYRGSQNVFEMAARANIPVVYVSSDHIFDGKWFGKYDENSTPNPLNVYGMTKFAAEAISTIYPGVHIVRTSTLFWKESQSISGLLADIKAGNDVHLPTYLWRSFLHIDQFCEMLNKHFMESGEEYHPRVLNLSGSKVVSWYKFIKDYAKAQNLDTSKVHPKYFEERNNGFAPRALRAGLNTNLSKKLGYPQYSYLDGLK